MNDILIDPFILLVSFILFMVILFFLILFGTIKEQEYLASDEYKKDVLNKFINDIK